MSLEIFNLDKSFGTKKIFESFSYSFADTGIYSISGNSGVGKTTLLRIIAGLDRDFSGEIIGGGFDNVAFVFQEYRLFPSLNALENVIVPNGNTSNEALRKDAEKMLSALDFKRQDFLLDISELSGGMKQRISLARALISDKPVLLLDEPTKELDEKIRKSLYELIKSEAEKRLIIIVSHHNEDFENLNAIRINI